MTEPTMQAGDVPPGEDLLGDAPAPDHTKSRDRAKPLRKLGANKKPRSPVRAMLQSDEDKLAQLYVMAGMAVMPFHEKAGTAFATSAEGCAQAWRELAQTHDGVRRVLLGLLEGGAWGAVILAHVPIAVAVIPEDTMARFPFLQRSGESETATLLDFPNGPSAARHFGPFGSPPENEPVG